VLDHQFHQTRSVNLAKPELADSGSSQRFNRATCVTVSTSLEI
jgi:hypothetical protein